MIEKYKGLLQDKSSIKFYKNPKKWIATRIAIHKLSEDIRNRNIADCTNYESARQIAELFHYFYPQIGNHATCIGTAFHCNKISSWYVIPDLYRIVSASYYVEFDVILTESPPYVNISNTSFEYIYKFRVDGDIDVLITTKSIIHTPQGEETICRNENKKYSFSEKSFFISTEYYIFRNAVICTLNKYY